MPQLDSWESEPSYEQMAASRKILATKFSILDLFVKHSREVFPTGGGTWSHKCICPHPDHKQGQERSPSCYFSESERNFSCFGCEWYGDVFDLLGLMTGVSAETLVKEAAGEAGLNLSSLSLPPPVPKMDLNRINQRLSTMLRDHLQMFRETPCYADETAWTDRIFRDIDDRLERLEPTDVGPIRQLYEGTCMSLERRKNDRAGECLK